MGSADAPLPENHPHNRPESHLMVYEYKKCINTSIKKMADVTLSTIKLHRRQGRLGLHQGGDAALTEQAAHA